MTMSLALVNTSNWDGEEYIVKDANVGWADVQTGGTGEDDQAG